MDGSTLFLVIIGIVILLVFAKIASRPSRYGRSYQIGQQIAEDHPGLTGRDLACVQSLYEYQVGHDDYESVNGFWDGYKGNDYNEEGYDGS